VGQNKLPKWASSEYRNHTPTPDEELQLQQAGETSASALRRYMTALAELNNFETRGILPADFEGE